MARLFDDANTQYLEIATPVVTAIGLSFHARVRSDDATIQQAVLAIANPLFTNRYLVLQLMGNVAGDPVSFGEQRTGTGGAANTTTGYTAGQWHSILGVEISRTSRAVYIDGGSKGTDATDVGTNTDLTNTSIGRLHRSTIGQYFSGDIAEAAVWNAALSDADALMLATGICPLVVRPSALVAYWPLVGKNSPETDIRQAFNLTLSASAPVASAHPRILHPSRFRKY